jgi:hypothetical protein
MLNQGLQQFGCPISMQFWIYFSSIYFLDLQQLLKNNKKKILFLLLVLLQLLHTTKEKTIIYVIDLLSKLHLLPLLKKKRGKKFHLLFSFWFLFFFSAPAKKIE